MARAELELLAGDAVEAERLLREGGSELESLGERGFLSTALAQLARVLCAQERFDEAEQLALRALETGSRSDLATRVLSLRALALVHASRGELDDALGKAREAAGIEWDLSIYRAEADLDLARIQRAAGLQAKARESVKRAIELCAAKGLTVVGEQAHALLAEL